MKDLDQDGGSVVLDAPLGGRAGFATAALPVAAQSLIHTHTSGLDAGTATIQVGGQALPLYHAHGDPTPNEPRPPVADYRPSCVENDARDGWTRALERFRQHGVA